MPGLTPELTALLDAYVIRYAASIVTDNDQLGRDVVVARCKELVNTLPPAEARGAA